MTPILATDYGNLYAFLRGVPALLLALLLVAFGVGFRRRSCHLIAGIIFLLAGIQFLISLPDAKTADDPLTTKFGWSALAFAAIAFLIAAATRPRSPSATIENPK